MQSFVKIGGQVFELWSNRTHRDIHLLLLGCWFDEKNFQWERISRYSTLWKSTIKCDHHFYGQNEQFFRQLNFLTKELISRNFLSMRVFYSTFLHCARNSNPDFYRIIFSVKSNNKEEELISRKTFERVIAFFSSFPHHNKDSVKSIYMYVISRNIF